MNGGSDVRVPNVNGGSDVRVPNVNGGSDVCVPNVNGGSDGRKEKRGEVGVRCGVNVHVCGEALSPTPRRGSVHVEVMLYVCICV